MILYYPDKMVCERKYIYLMVILIWMETASCFEPISTISLGIAAGTTLFVGWNKISCKFVECCDSSWIPQNFTMLETSLRTQLFGQHLAHEVVLTALKAHFRENATPKKALALSFHGWSGSGKTYVSQFIMNSIFSEGAKSKYVHFFAGRNHFPMESQANIYKLHLSDWIRGNVTNCERSLFVFDEVDKMPKGVLDAITPFIDYHEQIDGVDFRKTIFIFLSNTGSNLIVQRLLSLWETGTKREDIKLRDFEDLIRKGAFNEKGGFHQSETIESNLIDHYVPFLPMEEVHVKQCIKAEFHRRGVLSPPESYIKEVLRDLTFVPEPHNLYSNSGCKRIIPKVATLLERLLFDM